MGDFDVEEADLDRYMTGDRQLLMGRWNTSVCCIQHTWGVSVEGQMIDRLMPKPTCDVRLSFWGVHMSYEMAWTSTVLNSSVIYRSA